MPHLKFTRDRRGYESTFLVRTVRQRGRERVRVLYWFRTPPHVKVGRAAIDEVAIRDLEDEHPDVDFDWDRILSARPPAPEPEETERVRGRERDRRREARRPTISEAPAIPPATAVSGPVRDQPAEPVPDRSAEPVLDQPADASTATPAILSDLEEPSLADEFPSATDTPSAAEQALGREGLLRLRARYAEVQARIKAAAFEPGLHETLLELAEQLNPDAWVTPDEVTAGLEHFERVLADIGRHVGLSRGRSRRGGRRNRRRRDRYAETGAHGMPQDSGQQAPAAESDDINEGSGPD